MYRTKIKFPFLFIPLIVIISCSFVWAEESISITTYYPSPYGVYNELRLYPHSTPVIICDATTEGTMFFNSTSKLIQVCSSGGWGSNAAYWADSGNDIYNTNSGYVGVGTNNPSAPLHVYSPNFSGGEIKIESVQNWRGSDIHYQADGREWGAGAVGSNYGALSNSFFITDQTANGGLGIVRVAVKPDGRVGIGTKSPNGTLDVNGTLYFAGGGGQPYVNFPSIGLDTNDEALFLPTYTNPGAKSDLRLYIEDGDQDRFSIWGNSCSLGDCANLAVSGMQHYFQANGNAYHKGKLGIGIDPFTDPNPLQLYGGLADIELEGDSNPSNYSDIHFDNTNAGGREYVIGNYPFNYAFPNSFFIRDNAGGDRLIINSSGNVGIGVTLPAYQLQLSVDSAAKPTSNLWTIPSDIRVKKNIRPFTDGFGVIEKINPVSYKLNGKAGLPPDQPGIGVVAQDIKDVAPYTIKTWKAKLEPTDSEETELYDFDANALTYVLINAVKEQQKQIEDLKAQIIELQRN